MQCSLVWCWWQWWLIRLLLCLSAAEPQVYERTDGRSVSNTYTNWNNWTNRGCSNVLKLCAVFAGTPCRPILCPIHTARQTRQDRPVCVVSGMAVWIGRLLLTCSDFRFSVVDSLELSRIQFTPPMQTRHRQDCFVWSGLAVWIGY